MASNELNGTMDIEEKRQVDTKGEIQTSTDTTNSSVSRNLDLRNETI
jgi:hypothetical protein